MRKKGHTSPLGRRFNGWQMLCCILPPKMLHRNGCQALGQFEFCREGNGNVEKSPQVADDGHGTRVRNKTSLLP